MRILVGIITLSTLWMAGCSNTELKGNREGARPKQGSISFTMVNEKIFTPSCIACHSGSHLPFLTNYQEIKSRITEIQVQVIEKQKMPKKGPLPQDEMDLLKQWIADGAPEFAQTPETAPTPPAPTGGDRPVMKWAELSAKLLKSKCFNCHYKNNLDKVSDLEDYNTFVGTIGTSYFVTVVTPAMPPAPKGTPEGAPNPNQLTRSEKEMLSNWIVDGMK